jgi:hypothetical protein
MSLILAVEPDRRQSAHLTHIVRQRVGAELILAETTELALASIGNRVPDLILVPPLMSPQDDAALAAALRVIATAAHVQMLTTPLFATATPAPRGRGVLGVFRRSKPSKPSSTDGCDPAEFAQQISSYLQSAAEERAVAQHVASQPASAPPPITDSSGRYMPLDANRLYRDQELTHPQLEAATPEPEPTPEPVAPMPEYEPVAPFVEPVAEIEESIVAIDEPVIAIVEPVEEILEPVVALEPEPLPEAAAAMHEAVEAVSETPATASIDEPIAALPEPIVETAEPFLEAPEPIAAAAESSSQRRIGFVPEFMREEEADQPIEIAASLDDAPVLEVVAETEAVELSEPMGDEAIELFEVVSDDDDQEEGAIDLSAEFAAFDRVHESVEAEAVEAVELDAEIVEVLETPEVEILETPAIIEAVEPIAPQIHAIHADPMREFAAAVEAMTAVDQTAVESRAADPVNYDDLFPPREPVEPSPLGAWRSWMPLEGITAEAADAPVPMHVVERAVERTPERPDWVQLIESLRVDVERRRSERPSDAPKPVRKTPSRPIQDEWGLFDPAQCGFAALLEKLDEITEANESRPHRSA